MEWSDTDLAHLLASARLYGFWGSLTEGLRTGLLQNEAKGGGQNMFEVIYSDRVKLAQFARAMSAISADTARAIAAKFHWQEHRSVIDIGCAEGAVPVQIARAHEHITGAGSDLPALESIFDAYVARFGLGQRLGFTAGDFFTDPPPHADVLVMGHILHDWDLDQKRLLMRNAYDALPEGGALIVYDAIIDDERCSSAFGLLMSRNYVDRHMALGYASTAHAAEGRTVDSGHCLYGTGMDAAGLLVSMTRGRERNTGYAVTRPEPAKGMSAPGEVAQVKEGTAEAVLGDLLDRAEIERGTLAAREQAERDAASAMTNGDRLIHRISRCTAARTSQALDQLVADGVWIQRIGRGWQIRRRGRWMRSCAARSWRGTTRWKLAQTVSARGFNDATAPAAALYARLSESLRGQSTPAVGSFADLIPADIPEQWRPWLGAPRGGRR